MGLGASVIAEFQSLLCCVKAALLRIAPETTRVTTAGAEIIISGTKDYADVNLLSFSITVMSGTVQLNDLPIPVGLTQHFSAEAGALLGGPFLVDCGGAAGTAFVSWTLRSAS